MSYANDGRVLNSNDETMMIRAVMASWDLAPAPPPISLVKTDEGRRVVTHRMLLVAEQRIASDGSVSRDYLRTQFTEEEIAACWPGVEKRLRPSIRDLGMAA